MNLFYKFIIILIVIILGLFYFYLIRRQLKNEALLKKEINKLYDNINDHIRNNQSKILIIIEDHNEILYSIHDLISKNEE
jgi:hypothetical protein